MVVRSSGLLLRTGFSQKAYTTVRKLIRLFRGDDGQDLIEYAFLCVFVAFAAFAAWQGVRSAMTTAYGAIDNNEQGIWRTPDPPPAAGS